MKFKLPKSSFSYRRNLPHLQRGLRPLFVTFHTLAFLPLPPAALDVIFDVILREHLRRIHIHAFVVMPEHVHILFSPLLTPGGNVVEARAVLQAIKSISARQVNRALERKGAVWDEEWFDHWLRSTESLKQKIEYIEQNPVRRGLAKTSSDYKWLWINDRDFV